VSNNEKNDSDNDNDECEEEKIGLILSHSKNNDTQNDTEIVEEDPVSLRINRVLDDYIKIILVNNYGSIDAVPKKYNLQKWKKEKSYRFNKVKQIEEDKAVQRALKNVAFSHEMGDSEYENINQSNQGHNKKMGYFED
jgi:hypothetical protein